MTSFSHEEIQELLGAYALDAVDGEEYEAVEVHLRTCPRCRAEVTEHRETAALIAHGGAPAPEGVWDRIRDSLEPAPPRMRLDLRPDGSSIASGPSAEPSGVVSMPTPAQRARRVSRPFLAVLSAAAVIIVMLAVVLVRLDDRSDLPRTVAAIQLRDVASNAWVDPDARRVELRSADGNVVAPAAVTPAGEGYLLAKGTPGLDDARTYQLWALKGTRALSLGTFAGGTDVVAFRVNGSIDALAVTEEVAGGVAAPSRTPLLSGKF